MGKKKYWLLKIKGFCHLEFVCQLDAVFETEIQLRESLRDIFYEMMLIEGGRDVFLPKDKRRLLCLMGELSSLCQHKAVCIENDSKLLFISIDQTDSKPRLFDIKTEVDWLYRKFEEVVQKRSEP